MLYSEQADVEVGYRLNWTALLPYRQLRLRWQVLGWSRPFAADGWAAPSNPIRGERQVCRARRATSYPPARAVGAGE
jgi:hypothetical protein